MEQQHVHEDTEHISYLIEHNMDCYQLISAHHLWSTFDDFTYMAKFEPCSDTNLLRGAKARILI